MKIKFIIVGFLHLIYTVDIQACVPPRQEIVRELIHIARNSTAQMSPLKKEKHDSITRKINTLDISTLIYCSQQSDVKKHFTLYETIARKIVAYCTDPIRIRECLKTGNFIEPLTQEEQKVCARLIMAFHPVTECILSQFGRTHLLQCYDFSKSSPEQIRCASLLPEGTTCAALSHEGKLFFFDEHANKIGPFTTLTKPIYQMSVHPQSTECAIAHSTMLTIMNINTLKMSTLTTEKEVLTVAYSDKGNFYISTSSDSQAQVYEHTTHTPLFTLNGHQELIMSACIHEESNRIATASSDGTIKIWNLKNGECLSTIPVGQHIFGVCFNAPASHIYVAAHDKKVYCYDLTTLTSDFSLPHTVAHGEVRRLFYVDAENMLVTTTDDGCLHLWNIETHQKVFSKKIAEGFHDSDFSRTSLRYLATKVDGTLELGRLTLLLNLHKEIMSQFSLNDALLSIYFWTFKKAIIGVHSDSTLYKLVQRLPDKIRNLLTINRTPQMSYFGLDVEADTLEQYIPCLSRENNIVFLEYNVAMQSDLFRALQEFYVGQKSNVNFTSLSHKHLQNIMLVMHLMHYQTHVSENVRKAFIAMLIDSHESSSFDHVLASLQCTYELDIPELYDQFTQYVIRRLERTPQERTNRHLNSLPSTVSAQINRYLMEHEGSLSHQLDKQLPQS